MEHEHLSAQTLEEWLALDRTETLNRSLLHQIAVCPECRRVGGWLLDLYRSGLGDRLAGRRALATVRRELLAERIAYDAALVTLETAVLDLEDGRTNAVKEMAAEMVTVFEAQEVHREAIAAFLMLQEAAAKETATVSLIQEVAAALERARLG
jgi:hypothetical protein